MTHGEGFRLTSDHEVYVYDPKARSCPGCHSIGPPREGCLHPWHQASATKGVLDDDGTHADEHVPGPGPRLCGYCQRLVGSPKPPCAACPDARAARGGRCPDGGYCHGSSLAAGSRPCEPGTCWRVKTSGPLSNVYPGNRWPAEVLAANGIAPPADALPRPDGGPLSSASAMSLELSRVLGVAMGSRSEQAVALHLKMAASIATEIVCRIVQAHQHLTGEQEIQYQGETYTGRSASPVPLDPRD